MRSADVLRLRRGSGLTAGLSVGVVALVACVAAEATDAGETGAAPAQVAALADSCNVWTEYRRQIGEDSPKIRRDGEQVFVWAGGDESGPGAEWYEVTDTPINIAELQYGLGADAIPSIDVPLFVAPDDPRLMDIPPSPYRRCERPQSADEIMVIGYVAGGTARAYPTALLDRHEVVNEEANGKPFAVGW